MLDRAAETFRDISSASGCHPLQTSQAANELEEALNHGLQQHWMESLLASALAFSVAALEHGRGAATLLRHGPVTSVPVVFRSTIEHAQRGVLAPRTDS